MASADRAREIVALDEALQSLSAIDASLSQVVELRFFGGLTLEETAEVLRVSDRTVSRTWDLAKAWLRRELDAEEPTESRSLEGD
jgi:RNA polymerase sigma factor (sigma-70 family)